MSRKAPFMKIWLAGAVEITAIRAQLEQLEQAWLRAEADANYWYAIANNPELAAQRDRELRDTRCVDVRHARAQLERAA